MIRPALSRDGRLSPDKPGSRVIRFCHAIGRSRAISTSHVIKAAYHLIGLPCDKATYHEIESSHMRARALSRDKSAIRSYLLRLKL